MGPVNRALAVCNNPVRHAADAKLKIINPNEICVGKTLDLKLAVAFSQQSNTKNDTKPTKNY